MPSNAPRLGAEQAVAAGERGSRTQHGGLAWRPRPLAPPLCAQMEEVRVNGVWANLSALPAPGNASHGALYYNRALALNPWPSGNLTYNDTTATVFVAGAADGALRVAPFKCPAGGCEQVGAPGAAAQLDMGPLPMLSPGLARSLLRDRRQVVGLPGPCTVRRPPPPPPPLPSKKRPEPPRPAPCALGCSRPRRRWTCATARSSGRTRPPGAAPPASPRRAIT
jgi:hypothetical protein